MSQNDRLILRFIRVVRQRIGMNLFLNTLIVFLGVGLALGGILNVIALFIPIYRALFWAIGMVMLAGVAGVVVFCISYPEKQRAALLADHKGLQERVVTSLEVIHKKDPMSELLKEDTVKAIGLFSIKKNIPIKVASWRLLVFVVVISLFVVPAVIPTKAKVKSILKHELKQKVKEEVKAVKKLEKELKKAEALDEKSKMELEKVLKKSRQELKKSKSLREIKKATDRLEKKLQQKATQTKSVKSKSEIQKLADKFNKMQQAKGETKEEMLKKIEKMKKVAKGMSDEKMKELLEKMEGELAKGKLSSKELQNLKEAVSEAMMGESESYLAEGELGSMSLSSIEAAYEMLKNGSAGQGAQQVQMAGKGNGNGGSSGSGTGNGTGNGKGNGLGSGAGSGGGSGWNYGGKQGVEKDNATSENSEKVTIPGRNLGQDKNLTGKKSKGKSYITSGNSGLAWAGDSVDYDQVIGEYSEDAYSKIENNSVPANMKGIVKSYFDGLNE